MKRFFLALLMMVTGIVTIGCYVYKTTPLIVLPTPISWESLCGMTRQQFAEMNETQVRQWLIEKYRTVPNEYLRWNDRPQDDTGFYITKGNSDSISVKLRQGKIILIELVTPVPVATFAQVKESLGSPETIDRYRYVPVVYEGVAAYLIGLNYPSLGVSVSYMLPFRLKF
jgi:hypothetical protein